MLDIDNSDANTIKLEISPSQNIMADGQPDSINRMVIEGINGEGNLAGKYSGIR